MKKKLLILLVGCSAVLMYQNCSKRDMQFKDIQLSQSIVDVGYRYTEAPKAYFDFYVVSKDITNAKSHKFTGVVAPSNGAVVSTEYKVEMLDSSDVRVCGLEEGTLAPQQTWVEFECVGLASVSLHKTIFSIRFAGESEWISYEKTTQSE